MKKQTAWNGFYKAVKEIKVLEAQAQKDGHDCNVRTVRRAAEMRAAKYAKSLVLEHGWQDVHTKEYIIA